MTGQNEKLIEDAFKKHEAPAWELDAVGRDAAIRWHMRGFNDALAVFEKAHTPTDDEREALLEVVRGGLGRGTVREVVEEILTSNVWRFRRSQEPEPSADESHLRGHWSNGDPVHVITNGVDRWIAPNHNGATWIEDAS